MNRLSLFLGSVAGTGFFPFAPATFTTLLLALLFAWWGPGPVALGVMLGVGLLVSVPLATRMERLLGEDPSACTVDEFVGYLIPLQGRDLSAPGSWKLLVAAFFLFRFFDILKIWPGRRLEHLPEGWGIVADDTLAGLYSLGAVLLLSLWLPWF
ncbi:MAG: phosphatidylglycerophosphatase A [Candidatus Krumholzibacteriia bacterium]|nr:phosphatidylglycerophosphatase A [bacterium]MCB9514814.1 phosphatidylglycerophosphatase A [Candidatus Latescibacterota bacterium]